MLVFKARLKGSSGVTVQYRNFLPAMPVRSGSLPPPLPKHNGVTHIELGNKEKVINEVNMTTVMSISDYEVVVNE